MFSASYQRYSGRGDAMMRNPGRRGDAGTWRHGDAGTRRHGDTGDVATRDAGTGDPVMIANHK